MMSTLRRVRSGQSNSSTRVLSSRVLNAHNIRLFYYSQPQLSVVSLHFCTNQNNALASIVYHWTPVHFLCQGHLYKGTLGPVWVDPS